MRRSLPCPAAVLLALALTPAARADDYQWDNVHSSMTFKIEHLGISYVHGRFNEVAGQFSFDPKDPAKARFALTIQVASIDTNQKLRDEHLRTADFFEVEKYPTMSYRSTGIRPDGDGFVMEGELTLKGVTLPVPLRLVINGFSVDPYASDPAAGARAGFTATGEINRMDFGVSYNGPVPGGGVLLGEKVQIILEIEAALQASSHPE